MRCFFDPHQLAHAPAQEWHNGGWVAHAEHPGRARAILDAVGQTEQPRDHGDAPLLRVHSPDYIAFLKSAHERWEGAGRSGDATGYVWPVKRRPLNLLRIDALLGQYSIDAGTPIGPGTWNGAYWSAQSAVSAAEAVLAGDPLGFALCRPPGHHAGADYLGGYCYLNNSAIAAEAAVAAGKRVAILDIDYHHGNGTQDIFYARGDVLFTSLHADPATDYPFYWGHADEIGEGEGEGEGANLNLPLPQGTGIDPYRRALEQALDAIAAFKPDVLVCSYGADTFVDDPISHFTLETRDYRTLARDIAGLELPTIVVMEGGYAAEALGTNVAHFLSGF